MTRDPMLSFRVTPTELAAIKAAAVADGRTVSSYLRAKVLGTAKATAKAPKVRE